MNIIRSSLVALVCTLFCIWLFRPVASRIGLVDRPGGRKWHQDDVPLIGGIAMFCGFCFSILTLHISLESYRGLVAGSGLLVLMGVVDDFIGLGAKLRLCGQLIAVLFLMIWGGQEVNNLGNLFFLGDIQLYGWAFPLTAVMVIGYLNAMNMVDGQDGLAGGIALSQILSLLILSFYLHRVTDSYFLILAIVLLVVFLSFNMPIFGRKKASIFMGDSGSTFVAFLIAWFAINISQSNPDTLKPVTILWILAFPLFDLINVMFQRIWSGRSPFTAGRDHFHHVLHGCGLNTTLSTWLLIALSLLLSAVGIGLNFLKVVEGWQFIALLLALFSYLYFVRLVRDK